MLWVLQSLRSGILWQIMDAVLELHVKTILYILFEFGLATLVQLLQF